MLDRSEDLRREAAPRSGAALRQGVGRSAARHPGGQFDACDGRAPRRDAHRPDRVDPVGSGFVASIARPGGNTTGFTNFEPSLIGKWLELLKQIAPSIVRAGVIFNPKTAPGEGSFFMAPFEPIARALDVEPIAVRVSDPTDRPGGNCDRGDARKGMIDDTTSVPHAQEARYCHSELRASQN